MEYYIITDISENYNYINDLAYKCKMEIIDYLKYSIMTSFNVDIQNIKIIDNNISKEKNIVYDVISNDYDSIKDFVSQYFEDEDHYNLIHKIIIK